MEFHAGGDFARQAHDGEILHDHAVGTGFGDGGDGAGGFAQFVFEDQGVEGDVAADAAGVEGAHGFGEFFEIEADFGAGGEMFQAEINAVGAGFDGGVELRPVAGGALYFGLACPSGCHRTAVTPTSLPVPCEHVGDYGVEGAAAALGFGVQLSGGGRLFSFRSTLKPADWS